MSTLMAATVDTSVIDSWTLSTEWILAIVSPFSSIGGIPLSLSVILCMPFALTSNKTKVFYVAIAAFGLAPLIFMHLFNIFASNSLPFVSGGTVIFELESVAPVACQISMVATAAGECGAAYVTAVFAVERYVAVRYPFAAQSFTLNRASACVAIIAISTTTLNCMGFYTYVPSPLNTFFNMACAPRDDAAVLLLGAFLIDFVAPNCFLFVMTVMVFWSLKQHVKGAAKVHAGVHGRIRTYGVRTTIVLLAVASSRCVMYVCYSITYIAWQFIPVPLYSLAVRLIANDVIALTGLTSVGDFVVYLALIPDFRARILLMVRCRSWWD